MARGDCNITNICIPTRRIIYSAGFTPPPPDPPVECNFPDGGFSQGGTICSWDYRVRYDIDPAQVPSDQSNYPLMVFFDEVATDLSPGDAATFWNEISRDSIRVTAINGTTELPHYTHLLDNINETGYMSVLVPTVSASVQTSIFIYFANPAATEYAVGNPLGRNAVFAEFEALWDFEQNPAGSVPQLPDLTGNGHNATVTGPVSRIIGKIGSAWEFGVGGYATPVNPTVGTDEFELAVWERHDRVGAAGIIGWSRPGSVARGEIIINPAATQVRTLIGSGTSASFSDSPSGRNDNVWRQYLARKVVTGGNFVAVLYENTSSNAPGASISNSTSPDANTFRIAIMNQSDGTTVDLTRDLRGDISLASLRGGYRSGGRIVTEYNNQNAPGTFATFTNFLANT